MAEKAINRSQVCKKLEQWLDAVTKKHNEVIQKCQNHIGSEEQARSVSSR